jgi:hypothetical protein
MSEGEIERQFVAAKTREIVADVSARTGVSETEVIKVLEHLGLSTSLASRIKVSSVRIASGGGPI